MKIAIRTKKFFCIYILIVVLACAAITGTTARAQDSSADRGKKGLKITLLLYSGRPDPSFVLDDEESLARVKNLFGKSKAKENFQKETVVPSILGYKGIVVENLDNTIANFPPSLIVHKGTVEAKDERKKFLTDEGNELENFLLDKAKDRKIIDEDSARKIKAGK